MHSAMTRVRKGSLPARNSQIASTVPSAPAVHDSIHLRGTITALFEEQVRRTPAAVAAEYGTSKLTYESLHRQSNRLSHYLRKTGVGPETLVGVCLQRSMENVVVLLAILKAGGVYVPLDASYPAERLRFMAEDAGLQIIVTTRATEELWLMQGRKQLCLEDLREQTEKESEETLHTALSAGSLAYVIYTSGSTGKPKGVGVAHGAAAAHLNAIGNQYGYGETDKVLQSASLSFDVSIEQILAPLLAGARLVFVDHPFGEPSEFCASVRELGITVCDLPPAYWGHLIPANGDPAPDFGPLRLMIVGGDVMPLEGLRRWHETINANVKLLNAYGPTEAVITATLFRTSAVIFENGNITSVPIGHLVGDRKAYVLDKDGQECAAGVAGELCLAGPLLARGYLQHPDLTAAKFVPDPFSAVGGERLYCTGDLAVWREDGMLEFVKRRDRQVKVRGFRIELGEVEAVLRQHPAVKDCVVVPHQDRLGEQNLAAYFTCRNTHSFTGNELRTHAQNRLPGYMVPAYFTVLEQIPLTPDGKLDRSALPDPVATGLERNQPYVAPRTATEKQIAQIWGELLGLDHVGAHDRFFELGGNSLLATRAIGRIRHEHGIDVPLRALLENLTVAEIADFYKNRKETSRDDLPFVTVDRNRPIPLSFSQERVWFLEQLNPGLLAYTFQATIRFEGTLVPSALEKAFNVIVERHEILRTTFHEVNGTPVQVVHSPRPVTLPVIQVEDAVDPERAASDFIQREIRKPFRVDQGPPIYWNLIRVRPDSHILLHREHHFIHDGWGFNVILRELFELYRSFTGGSRTVLPAMPIQFADFASWQREWVETNEAKRQVEYWKQKLAGAPDLLVLPWDHPRPQVPAYRGDELRIELPEELCIALRQRSREQGVTLFMTTFAAFAILMQRVSGATDLCIGSGIADRRWKEIENMLGMVVNNVVLRCDLSEDLTVARLLQQVRETALEAYDNQDIPYDKVVEALQPKRHLSYPPVFQVMFSFHDSVLGSLDLPECKIKLMEGVPNGSAKWDLNITLIPRAEQALGRRDGVRNNGITLAWEYCSDLFEEATMWHWMRVYQNLLRAVADGPQKQVSELPLLSPEEQEFILAQNRQTRSAPAPAHAVHELFEIQAARIPDAVAVEHEGRQLKYGELNRLGNQVGRYLKKLGVRPEARVGICMKRSPELIAGLLGVLKAGGAYVPLDPNYPPERLRFMIDDAQVGVLLTERSFEHLFEKNIPPKIYLDETWEEIARENSTDLKVPLEQTNLAYVIYTSGSTGRPKGVAIAHRGVSLLLHWGREAFSDEEIDGMLFSTSVCFDLSVFEMFLPLCWGGFMVIAENALELPQWVGQDKLKLVNIVPSAIAELLKTNGMPESVRVVCLGGEGYRRGQVQQIYEQPTVQRVINVYGPTEDTVYSTYEELSKQESSPFVVIGKPLGSKEAYVLDARMHLTPVSVAGELYLGGEGVARGYLNRPELTAERFVPNPFSQTAGGRLYRTGDSVKRDSSGRILFMGRLDHQVKIRGYRIELAEIEARLKEYPGIEETVVVMREDANEEKSLVAYYTTAQNSRELPEGHFDSAQLRAHMMEKLPEYMAPAAYIHLEAMPLTANGKLDRRSLPQPDRKAFGESKYEAPQGEIERELAALWADVLKRDSVGRDDNFFTLGGHSLLAMRTIARTRAMFRLEIPVRAIFQIPTIRAFGEALRALASSHPLEQHGPISRISREEELPLSLNQESRLLVEWWAEVHSNPIAPFHFFLAFSLGPEVSIAALERALDVLASRHESLRTTFSDPKKMQMSQLPPDVMGFLTRIKSGERIPVPEMHAFVNRLLFGKSIFQQTIHPEVTLKVNRIDLEPFAPEARESEMLRIATQAIETPFDYENTPLVRVLLFRKSVEQQLLLIVMPHLLGDAWSMEVFRRELELLYHAFTLGTPWRLPDLPVQAVDFAEWQRKRLRGAYLEEMTAYWRKRWSEFPLFNVVDLPFSKPAPESPGFMVETLWHTLDRSLSERLRQWLREKNMTLHMLWLAALNIQLHLYSHKEKIGVWGLFANRVQPETENLMGWLATGHVMGICIDPEQELSALLAQVKDVALDAQSHQEVPTPLLWNHFMKDLESNPGAARSPIQPHLSFVTETQTESQMNAFIEETRFPYRIGRLALKLVVIDSREDIQVFIRYSSDRFTSGTISRMMADWCRIVQTIADGSTRTIGEFAAVLQPGNATDSVLACSPARAVANNI